MSDRHKALREIFPGAIGICDFDMIFTFVWAGWEGIAHDSEVLTEVVHNPTSGFPLPPPITYWLADFRRRRALTNKEKFNHNHAQLRNVIERAYGVLKVRFPILKQMASYKFEVQRDVVIACFAIHNFIQKCNIQDHLFEEFDEDSIFNNEEEFEGHVEEKAEATQWGAQSSQYMADVRGVHTLMTEAGLVIHMLVEKKYPLRKKVLLQMLELKLESEEDSTMTLELIRFVKKLITELEPKNSDKDGKDL
ncbi:putative nuclease HARBI1 [Tanacetum coccineum]|uniref:Nuclease HARBI1 n=1 Tax=Tanacetum coccineum TaxID=301880 RepID=A0ABQ5B3D3_9ASTR